MFKAWTEPEHVARWWGPQGFTTTFCDMDITPGGKFRFCMRSPEGTDHWKRGVYREIVAPERVVFTFAWEDAAGNPGHELLTTVTFAEHGSKTKLTLHQAVFETVEGSTTTGAAGQAAWHASPNMWLRDENKCAIT